MKRKLLIPLVVLFILVAVTGCSKYQDMSKTDKGDNEEKVSGIEITDMLGRNINIDKPAEKAVAIGPGALRLYCYAADVEKLVGVEQIEIDSNTGRPYNIANESLKELQVIGSGGPNNQPDAEKLLSVKPDVIFTMYSSDASSVDKLQSKTGIPVIALSYGNVSVFDEDVYKSLKIIGTVMGQEDRANKAVDYMKSAEEDLRKRTENISDDKKPEVYIGALSSKGSHGIESTWSKYPLFDAVNALNVADDIDATGSVMIDKEKLLEWNPDIIFVDIAGINIVKDDYKKNPAFYNAINAVKNNRIYNQLPFNYYHTNIDTAIANAYYIGKVIYPDKFEDIDPETKADEIYDTLVGKKMYKKMAEDFAPYGNVKLN